MTRTCGCCAKRSPTAVEGNVPYDQYWRSYENVIRPGRALIEISTPTGTLYLCEHCDAETLAQIRRARA